MKIQHIHGLPPLYTNTFLITTDAGHGILIDAAAAPETYLDALKAENATLTHILLTHGHYDHVGAVAALKQATGCTVYMDPVDAAGTQLLPLKPGHARRQHAPDAGKPVPAGQPAFGRRHPGPAGAREFLHPRAGAPHQPLHGRRLGLLSHPKQKRTD